MADIAARGGRAAVLPLIGSVAWGVAMVLVLSAPALWNGFPLIYSDTGGYILRPIEGKLFLGRSALYGLFLDVGMPLSFWPNVIIQSAMAAWLVTLTLRALRLADRRWVAFAVVVALSIGTTLPWLTSLLMPDILFSAAVLALYLLIFHAGRIATSERWLLVGIIFFAIPSHMAAAGLCASLILAAWLAGLLLPSALKPRLSWAALAIAGGIALCPLSNLAITGKFAFTPGGSSFVFARILETGMVGRYLNERCPDPALRLCAYKDALPTNADRWLWVPDSPLHVLGAKESLDGEQKKIVLATLLRYPLMHLTAAMRECLNQLLSFRTEITFSDNAHTLKTIVEHAPSLKPRLMAAHQQSGPVDVGLMNAVHVPVVAAAMVGLVFIVLFRRRLNITPEAAALCATVLLALLVNAVICGVFSHSLDRYQSRLVWLAPFAVGVALAARPRLRHGQRTGQG
jgi:hypothetical protein